MVPNANYLFLFYLLTVLTELIDFITCLKQTTMKIVKTPHIVLFAILCCAFFACKNSPKNEYKNNTPTSGKLKVYYEEGLMLHVKNQAYTFQSLYPNVELELIACPGAEAFRALFVDSCEAIVVTRLLNDKEQKAFASKNYFPNYSAVAKTGVAVICNVGLALKTLSFEAIVKLLSTSNVISDTSGNAISLNVLFDKSNSSVFTYMMDSVLLGKKPANHISTLNSSIDAINYVASHQNSVAFIDFAWLSDIDDSLVIANLSKIKLLAIGSKTKQTHYNYPSQSSFKLETYPFARTVYVMRKIGDFTLAKGFESFVAGPKGQLIFLKQGLLPKRQAERLVQVNTEPLKVN